MDNRKQNKVIGMGWIALASSE